MRCEDVQDVLIDGSRGGSGQHRRAALEHLFDCPSCRDAQYAVAMLHADRLQAIPPPRPGALQRAVAAATQAADPDRGARSAAALAAASAERRRRGTFFSGVGLGGSLAAAAAVAWVQLSLPPRPSEGAGGAVAPHVQLSLNETRDINIAVEAPSALDGAEIRVVLTGEIGLAGYSDQKELRWRTDLDAGSNRLTLPVIATGSAGGQLLVEVQHGERRRTFVVDVHGTEA